MINLHESMGPGRDRTHDPWICSQTPKFKDDFFQSNTTTPSFLYIQWPLKLQKTLSYAIKKNSTEFQKNRHFQDQIILVSQDTLDKISKANHPCTIIHMNPPFLDLPLWTVPSDLTYANMLAYYILHTFF